MRRLGLNNRDMPSTLSLALAAAWAVAAFALVIGIAIEGAVR